MSKRYILVKADGDGPKSCAFFLSEKGCRNGADCKFFHGEQPTQGSASAAQYNSVLATKTADVAVSTSTTPITSSVSLSNANEGEKAAEDERMAKKARKLAKKAKENAKENHKIAINSEAHPDPTPLAPKTVAVPAASSTSAIAADTVVALENTLSSAKAKKRTAREKATREAAAHVARARATAAAAAAAAAAAEAEAAEAEAEAASVLEVEDPKPKEKRKKKNNNTVVEQAVAAPAPAVAMREAAPTSTGMAPEAVNPKPKKKRNKKMKEAEPIVVPPAGVAMPTSVPNSVPATALDNTTTTTTATAVATADGVSSPAVTPQREKSVKKLCSFFNKKKGCRTGALCPFLHAGVERGGAGGTRGGIKNRTPTPKQSEGVPQQHQLQQPSFVAPKSSEVPSPTPVPSTSSVAGLPSVALPMAPASVAALSPRPSPTCVSEEESFPARRKRGRPEASAIPSQVQPAAGGLLEGLPISPFVALARTEDDDLGDAQGGCGFAKEKSIEMEIPHVRADPWQELVDRTRAHPSFAKSFSFNTNSSWVEARACGDGCDALPQVVALDCEMSVSEDPVTKERNGKELVRLSIVRGEDGEKLLDTLVRPSNRVVSWLTDIHGVAPKHLEGVSFMQSHAQDAMMRLCCQRTVIIGHGLSNDLRVLKMKHARVVDTSFLFECDDRKFSTPSLRDVGKTILGRDIQSGSHDSVMDAQCALEAAKFALEARGAPLPAIQRTKRERPESLERDRKRGKLRKVSSGRGERRTKQTVDKEAKALMVHRLPLGTTEQQLLHLMEKKTRVVAVKAQPIEFNSATGKSHVIYESIAQVDLAFNAISTAATEDASGRLQKKIFLSKDGKKFISVRHPLIMDEGMDEGKGLPSMSSSEYESGSPSETE